MALILVAEDNDEIRCWVSRLLTRSGHTVLCAADGEQALAAIKCMGEDVRIDAILLDLVMPVVNGNQVLADLREREHSPPVLVISGFLADLEYNPGWPVVQVLPKPFSGHVLLEMVEEILRGQHGTDSHG